MPRGACPSPWSTERNPALLPRCDEVALTRIEASCGDPRRERARVVRDPNTNARHKIISVIAALFAFASPVSKPDAVCKRRGTHPLASSLSFHLACHHGTWVASVRSVPDGVSRRGAWCSRPFVDAPTLPNCRRRNATPDEYAFNHAAGGSGARPHVSRPHPRGRGRKCTTLPRLHLPFESIGLGSRYSPPRKWRRCSYRRVRFSPTSSHCFRSEVGSRPCSLPLWSVVGSRRPSSLSDVEAVQQSAGVLITHVTPFYPFRGSRPPLTSAWTGIFLEVPTYRGPCGSAQRPDLPPASCFLSPVSRLLRAALTCARALYYRGQEAYAGRRGWMLSFAVVGRPTATAAHAAAADSLCAPAIGTLHLPTRISLSCCKKR